MADQIDKDATTNKYTDVDYEVFSDAATHIMGGGSPYARKTYRYTPIAAYICLVNNLVHPLGCKVVFCVVDILMAMVYWRLCDSQLKNAVSKTGSTMLYVAIGWMFNPLVIQISTRGSNDNIISFLVFISIWLLLK